jgi:hypothetical protein
MVVPHWVGTGMFGAHLRPLDFPEAGLALAHMLRLREAGGKNQREKEKHCLTH